MDPKTLFHHRIHQFQSRYPDLRSWLAQNKKITMTMVLEDMQKYPQYKHEWQFKHLSYSIPVDTLLDHNIYPLNNQCKDSSICCMNLTIHTLLRTRNQIEWDWNYLTYHKNITIENILDHPELPWVPVQIQNNPNFIYEHYRLLKTRRPIWVQNHLYYIFHILSKNATYEQITTNPEQLWTLDALHSPHLQKHHLQQLLPYFIKKYPNDATHSQLAWICSSNPNLSFDDLLDLFGTIAFQYAYSNSNFTYQDFLKHPLHKWDVPSLNLKLPLDYIIQHPEYDWKWYSLLVFSSQLTYKDINRLPDTALQQLRDIWTNNDPDAFATKPFDIRLKEVFFHNHGLDPEDRKHLLQELLAFYLAHPIIPDASYEIGLYNLAMSPLFLEPTFLQIKEYFAKKKMIRILTEVQSNPAFKQCRKRLLRECSELNGVR
jgi:hypothetical protein